MSLKSFIQFLKEENTYPEDVNIQDVNIHDRGRRRKELSRQDKLNKYSFLKKEPKYIDLFHTFAEKEGKSEQELKDLYKDIQAHRNTLKQNKVDLSKSTTFEEVGDELTRMKLVEKTNKFVKLLPSSLRNEMKSNSNYMHKFSNLLMDYSYNDYKNSFMKKVSRYKDIHEFFGALEHHLESFAPRSKVFERIENDNSAEVVMSTDEFLVARIYNEGTSCNLGSSQWCISKNGYNHWDSYISGSNNSSDAYPGVQYFVWDFRFSNTDNSSLIGVTKYRNVRSGYTYNRGDGTYVAHGKSDNSMNIDDKDWYKYLVNFDNLTFKQQVKLVSENPKMEKYTGIIDSLDDKESRKLLKEIPRLLLYFKDLSFLTNDEIWNLVKRDKGLAKSLAVANELNEEQRILCIVKDPDLLEEKWKENPYEKVTGLLTRAQKIEMISNKHSLYGSFDLSEDEKFDLISHDPKIIVTYTGMAQEVDQLRLKKMYLSDKDRWDREISSTKSEKKTKIELALKHLIKSDERLKKESTNKVYIFIGYKETINGEEYILPDNSEGILMIGDILNSQNDNISSLLLLSSFDSSISAYWCWIPQDLLSLDDLKSDRYKFGSSYEEIINGDGSELDTKVFNHIHNNITFLG